MLPKFETDAFSAHSWLAGKYSLEWKDLEGCGAIEPILTNHPVPLVSLVEQVGEALPPFAEIARMLNGDAEQIAAAKASLAAFRKKARELNRQIEALGGYIDETSNEEN